MCHHLIGDGIVQKEIVSSKKTGSIQRNLDAVENFDKYPDTAGIRVPATAVVLGCSVATVWRLVRDDKLKAKKISEKITIITVGSIRKRLAV